MQDYASQIHDLFNDDSFPPIVAFSGKWGIGKTFYVENILKNELESRFDYKITYLTVLGITSLDDFKDLLIAKRYLEDKHDKQGVTHLTNLLTTVESVTGGTNMISSFIKGSAGAAKHYMLKNITDEVFIIDDIERIECTSLKKHIIGECLRITQNKNKFLFVTNEQELNLEKPFTEKTFSETISYDPDSAELYLILKSKLNHLINSKAEIEIFIKMYNIYNLRVLKRTLGRLEKLLDYLSNEDQNINLDLVKTMLLKDGLFITTKYYIENLKIDEIVNIEDKKEKLGLSLRNSLQLNKSFVEFIVGKNIELRNVLNLEQLPKISSPLDTLLFNNISKLSESQFDEGLSKLEEYILKTRIVEVSKFFQCLFYYDYLVQNKYTPENNEITLEKVENLAAVKEFYSSRGYVNLNIADSPYEELAKKYLTEVEKKQVHNEHCKLLSSMKSSFYNSELYDNKNYQMTPILNKIDIKEWKIFITNWNYNDIEYFAEYLYQRYKFVNADNYLAEESDILKEMFQLVEKQSKEYGPSLKKGALIHLGNAIKIALNTLEG